MTDTGRSPDEADDRRDADGPTDRRPTDVVFDLDGVLLDSETDLAWLDRALDATLRTLGLPATAENRRRLSPWRLHSFDETAATFGVDVECLWRTRNRHYTYEKVAAVESGEVGPFPDAAVLADLSTARRCHVLSNSPQVVVDAFVRANGYGEYVTGAVGRGEGLDALDRLKPDTHLFERLREQVRELDSDRSDGLDSGRSDGLDSDRSDGLDSEDELDPANCVYVGDADTDREFAAAVGMPFVRVRRDGDPPGGNESAWVRTLAELDEHL